MQETDTKERNVTECSQHDAKQQGNELALQLYKEGYDARFQTAQAIPVFINEMLVRLMYSVRRLIRYFANVKKEERSFKLLWKSCEPFSNATVKRMLTVAHKSEDISDTTKYEDHFVPGFRDRLIAISKSGRSLQSEDVQNFLKAKERGIRVELFVRKNKDDKVSKEFYYLGHMTASGNTKEFTMANTAKTAVEIEWILDVPVREDIYEYIVNS